MSDVNASPARSGGNLAADAVMASLRRGELLLPFGIVAILAVLLVPLPTFLLDAALALSFTFSILILMTVLFIRRRNSAPSRRSSSSRPCCGCR